CPASDCAVSSDEPELANWYNASAETVTAYAVVKAKNLLESGTMLTVIDMWPAPLGDFCSGPIEIPDLSTDPYEWNGDLGNYIDSWSATEPSCLEAEGSDVWFEATVPAEETLAVSQQETATETAVSILESCTAGECISSGADSAHYTNESTEPVSVLVAVKSITADPGQVSLVFQLVDCAQGSNVAPPADPFSSGGGSDSSGYGPAQLNDGQLESSCAFCWISASSSPGTSWIEYEWSSPQTLWGMSIDTAEAYNDDCSSSGRTLAGGTIQWWNGADWVDDGVVSNETDDWVYQFTAPVTTSRLRIYGAHAIDEGTQQSNPIIFEWIVHSCY
ncbi:MAG: hypothetical protein R6V85_02320, partial [Polyangia bacterium]